MPLEPHQTRCLAHADKTPAEWCALREECARAVQIRFDTPHDLANSVYLRRVCKGDVPGERFLPAADVAEN